MRHIALALAAVLWSAAPAHALNKQGARNDDADGADQAFNLSGYVFSGVFLFNPTYAARPGNSGLAFGRFGLHVDLDLYHRWLTLSYDENTFTDRSPASPGWYKPSEDDHIVGLLTNIPLPHDFSLAFAAHYEIDLPAYEATRAFRDNPANQYQAGYSQSYIDVYARAGWTGGPWTAYAALGGFAYNTSYAARPDNSGVALLRYVLHGEVELLPWLVYRLDLNFFTDRQEGPLTPTESDILSTVAAHWRAWELRFDAESDLNIGRYAHTDDPRYAHTQPIPRPGFNQFYLATVIQWSFDAKQLKQKKPSQPQRPIAPFPF